MKKERDIWEADAKCPACRVKMKKTAVTIQEISVRTWQCTKCGEELYHPVDIDKALLINKLKCQAAEVTVGELRDAPYVRFPKKMSILIHKGDTAQITARKKDEYLLKIEHNSEE